MTTIKKVKRVPDKISAEFEFYLSYPTPFAELRPTPPDPDGFSPLQCYYYHDSRGITLPCNEPVALNRALNGKKGINLQILMWVEGCLEGTFFPSEFYYLCKTYPAWVWKSFLNQLHKERLSKFGWIPTFMTEKGILVVVDS